MILRLAALGLATALPAADAVSRPAPELAVLLVEFQSDAKFIGFPQQCPGTTEADDGSGEVICTAILYEGPIRTVRHIGGAGSVRGARLRYAAHAYSMPAGMRLLVRAYRMPDADGLFAVWWKFPDARGEICLDADQARALGIEARWLNWRERIITGEGNGKRYRMRCLRA